MKYRIKEVEDGFGRILFYPQRQVLGFWLGLGDFEDCYFNIEYAQRAIEKHRAKHTPDKTIKIHDC